jgi:hypothetical protein
MTKLTARQIANRRVKREAQANSRAAKILCAAVTATYLPVVEEADFITDYAGRKVRQSKPTDDEIAHFLRNNRAVDQIDILEHLGEAAFDKIYYNGSIKRDASFNRNRKNNLYWVTEKAADLYGIPKSFQIASGATVRLVSAD